MNAPMPVIVDGEPTCASIAEVVGEYYGFTAAEIRSDQRANPLVHARHVTFWFCKTLTSKSLPEIGRHLGGRDHTTVRNGYLKITHGLASANTLQSDIAAIESILVAVYAKFGVAVNDRFPDLHAPDIARRIKARFRGEFNVSAAELRALIDFAASGTDQSAATAADGNPAIDDALTAAIEAAIATGRELERARYSTDEGRAINSTIRNLKALAAAWDCLKGETQ